MTDRTSLKSLILSWQTTQRELRKERREHEGMARHAVDLDRRGNRPTLRALYLAYALVRGVPYACVESKALTRPSARWIAHDAGCSEPEVDAWLDAARSTEAAA